MSRLIGLIREFRAVTRNSLRLLVLGFLLGALPLAPLWGQAVSHSPYSLATWFGVAPDSESSCTTPTHRGFDFWLGNWRVRGAAGRDAGSSRILRGLGGCAIDEFFGSTGRSQSAFRRASGEWIQTYVDNSGLTLRLRGAASPDSMSLADAARVPLGAPAGVALMSRFMWAKDPADGTVRQVWLFSQDSGSTWPVNFDGRYTRDEGANPSVVPLTVGPPVCTQRPAYRGLDSLLGTWEIRGEGGRVIGRSTVRQVLDGCLLEEEVTGAHFRRHSLIAYDRYVREWIWSSVDDRGLAERFVGTSTPSGEWRFRNELAERSEFCLTLGTGGPAFSPGCTAEAAQQSGIRYHRVPADSLG